MATSVGQPLVDRAHWNLRVAGTIGRAAAPSELTLKIVEAVGEAELRRQSSSKPDGAGFARVSATDAKRASRALTVRLE
jgi:hypothetical protein